jgi:DNA-3-methyladenine glycosylase I
MAPAWKVTPPKDDADYFDRMSKAIFTAGLNWTMVEKKWPNFKKAFLGFVPAKVSRFSEKEIRSLMKDAGIVRNEKKIRATVHNAQRVLEVQKEFGSFRRYLDSFDDEQMLQASLKERFHHLGDSTSRMFLWSAGYPLTPNKEERAWMKGHHEGH